MDSDDVAPYGGGPTRPEQRCPRRHRWAAPSLSWHPTRAERRARAVYEIESKLEMRYIWDEVCENAGPIGRITATGVAVGQPPVMGLITLGPPTRFSVALRPGQVLDDIAGIAPRLVEAYHVDDVVVRPLASGWVTVELVEDPPPPEPRPSRAPDPIDGDPRDSEQRSGPSEQRPLWRRTHLGRRDRRRPFGRPRSFGG